MSIKKELQIKKSKSIVRENIGKEEVKKHIENSPLVDLNEVFWGVGYKFIENEPVPRYGTGLGAGHYDIATVYHEIAHGIEIVDEDPERILLQSYGLGASSKIKVYNEFYDNYTTTKASERECRVFAIQTKLLEYVFNTDKEDNSIFNEVKNNLVTSLKYMDDFFLIPLKKDKDSYTLKEKEEERTHWLQNKFQNYYESYNINDLLKKYEKVKDIRNYKDWSIDKLLDESYNYHHVFIEDLLEQCDPFGAWTELTSPITEEEVWECVKNKNEKLVETPLWYELFSKNITPEENRKKHIQKIAYFVENSPKEMITIDVGHPELNVSPEHIVEDGNHRLAAFAVKHKHQIKAKILGSSEEIKERGLWGPSLFLEEGIKKLEILNQKKYNEKINDFFQSLSKQKQISIENNNVALQVDKKTLNEFFDINDSYIFYKQDNDLNEQEEKFKNIKIKYQLSENEPPLLVIKKDDFPKQNKNNKNKLKT